MNQYVEKRISTEDRQVLEVVKYVVSPIPNPNFEVSCHDVVKHVMEALVFHDVPGVKAERGHFWPNFEHSWIRLPSGHIIDAYPVGILSMPFLVDKIVAERLYLPVDTDADRLAVISRLRGSVEVNEMVIRSLLEEVTGGMSEHAVFHYENGTFTLEEALAYDANNKKPEAPYA